MPYHMFKESAMDESFGSFETFRVSESTADGRLVAEIYGGPGWYWWPCSPGCLPDGDPVGPFHSEHAAIADAQNF